MQKYLVFVCVFFCMSAPAWARSGESSDGLGEAYAKAQAALRIQFRPILENGTLPDTEFLLVERELDRIYARARDGNSDAADYLRDIAKGDGPSTMRRRLDRLQASATSSADDFRTLGILSNASNAFVAANAFEEVLSKVPQDEISSGNLMRVYWRVGKIGAFEQLAQKLLLSSSPRLQTFGHVGLGNVALGYDKAPGVARMEYNKALSIARANRLKEREAGILMNLASMDFQDGETEAFAKAALTAAQLNRQAGNYNSTIANLMAVVEMNSQKGMVGKACAYLKEIVTLGADPKLQSNERVAAARVRAQKECAFISK